MKLELFLVLAVVALVPSLSEGRNVSRCELRDKLGEVLPLHRRFERHRNTILAAIICEVDLVSNLNSNLVVVEGIRPPKSTAVPSTGVPATGGPDESSVKTTISSNSMAPVVNTSEPVSPSSGAVLVRRRGGGSHKRKPDSEETLNDVENKFDSEEMEEDDEHLSREKGGKSGGHHRGPEIPMLWSLGKYGIFQLTDSHFCDSGYRWSRNKCQTDCSAFTDDDITDDINCFIESGYWRHFLRTASWDCRGKIKTFFDECS